MYLLGIDIGTSGTKSVLFDLQGRLVASAFAEYGMEQPQDGWAEQAPELWWQAVCETVGSLLNHADIRAEQIISVGLSGQMHGLVMLDQSGQVLRPCILWCDGRTGAECREITEAVGRERLQSIAANPALPGFTAGKILWVRRYQPEIYEKCRHILLPKDYIRYRLTGELACDVSDASGTNLLDVGRRQWSREILNVLHLEADWLPRLYESQETAGEISRQAARETGLRQGTPVAAGAADNMAAAIGTGAAAAGKAFNTIGTSGVIFAPVDSPAVEPEGRVHTFCHAVPGMWAMMSCTLSAGLSLRWFRDQLCAAEKTQALAKGLDPYQWMDQQAGQAAPGAGGVIFLPYLMGERSPLLNEKLRGAFLGLSAAHGRQELIRAVMEGVAFSQNQCLQVLREQGIAPEQMILCGGGAKSAVWRQILTDLYGIPTVRISSTQENGALGAAILGGVAAGVYGTVEEGCQAAVKVTEAEYPCPERQAFYGEAYHKYCLASQLLTQWQREWK